MSDTRLPFVTYNPATGLVGPSTTNGLPLVFPAGSLLTGKNLWVDSVNGDNSTAVSGRLDKPYLTLSAAQTAASSGDTIIVGPGTYTPSANLAKAGVNWRLNNATIAGTGNIDLFTDLSGAMTFFVTGSGSITHVGHGSAFRIQNSSSVISVFLDGDITQSSTGTQSGFESAFYQTSGSLYVHVRNITGRIGGIYWDSGDSFITCDTIYSPDGGAVYSQAAAANQHLHVKASKIFAGTGGTPISIGGNAASAIWIEAKRIVAAATAAINHSGAKLYVTADKIEAATTTGGISIVNTSGGGRLYLELQKLEALASGGSTTSMMLLSDTTSFIRIGEIIGAGVSDAIVAEDGTHSLDIQKISVGGNGVSCDTGTVRLVGTRIETGVAKQDLIQTSGTLAVRSCSYDTAKVTGTITNDDPAFASYQPLDSDLTSWAAITRASGFDTFAATPSGSNLASLLTTALPASKGGTGLTSLGTGVATALGVNVGSAGAFVTFNGALGTPSSGTVTNLTGTASININGTVGATTPTTGAFTSETFTLSSKSTTALATPSALSATQYTAFASTVSGAAIMGFGTTNDVSLMNRAGTVVLGVGPNTTVVNIPGSLTIGTALALAQGGTGATALTNHGVVTAGASALTTIAPGPSGNVLTSNGTDWTSAASSSGLTIGSTAIASGTTTRILYDNAGTLGEYTLTGTGTVVAMAAAPTIAGGSVTALTTFALRDTTAAFDLTLAATSTSATLTAGRTLTLDMGNVAHTIKFGTTANTITFPNIASGTVAMLNASNTFSTDQVITGNLGVGSPLYDNANNWRLTTSTSLNGLCLGSGYLVSWSQDSGSNGTLDSILSRKSAGIVRFGTTAANSLGSWEATNGTLLGTFAVTGTVTQTAKTATYNNIATAGIGVVPVLGVGRVTAQSAANNSIATYTAPASDGSYEVSMNMNVTAVTAMSASLNCDYTDEGNTARTMIFPVQSLAGNFVTGGLITATGPYETPVMHIRVKASTQIKLYTSAGTYTGVTYTAEGIIKQTQ